MEMIKKILPFEVKEVAPRVLEFIGSTEDTDRQHDIIVASGWQLKHYKKNPVFMWAHRYDEPPIGKAVKVWTEENKLKFHVQFADRDTYEFADTIYKLYKGGFLRATSVGFIPIESEPIEVKEGEDFIQTGTKFLKQELLELSGCAVPANPDALAEAKAKGLLADMDRFRLLYADDVIGKPYPNEHACRLRNPDDFEKDSFKRTKRDHEGKEYSIIMGKLKGETTMTEQAYRYDKTVWTPTEAKSHCSSHDGSFEAASESDNLAGSALPSPITIDTTVIPEKKEVSQADIADDIDYLVKEITEAGMNPDNTKLAWDLVRLIMRSAGDDIPDDIAEIFSAHLDRTNRGKLETIRTLAETILNSSEPEPESMSREEIEKTIIDTVAATIDKARGKIRR